jgi:transposase
MRWRGSFVELTRAVLAKLNRRPSTHDLAPGKSAPPKAQAPLAAVDDPGRFRCSKAVGAQFGLTPTRYQSGETDVAGRISKIDDASVRIVLYEAANLILTRPVKGSALKSWAARQTLMALRPGSERLS